MKKSFILFFITCLTINFSVIAQWGNSNTGTLSSGKAADIKWNKTEHNFGKIQQGKPQKATFKMTNTGGSPVIITNAKGSCGCTNIVYPKQPVLPGQTINVTVTYDAEERGSFEKTVILTLNIEKIDPILQIRGEVE